MIINFYEVNREAITVEDCIEMRIRKDKSVVLSNGKVVDFEEDK